MGGKNIFYSFSRWKWWANSGDYWSWHWPRNQFQSAVLILIAAVDEVKRLIVPIAGQWFSELMGFYWGLKTAVQRALLKFRTSAIDLAQHYGHDRLLGFMVFTSAWAGVYIFYLLGYENNAFSSLGLKYSCLVTMAHTVGNIRHSLRPHTLFGGKVVSHRLVWAVWFACYLSWISLVDTRLGSGTFFCLLLFSYIAGHLNSQGHRTFSRHV